MKPKTSKNREKNDYNYLKQTDGLLLLDKACGFSLVRHIGRGTFGAVFEVQDSTGHHLSIKKVLQDPRFKNRELEICQKLDHPNILPLLHYFFTKEGIRPEIYLHLVTPLFPMDLSMYLKLIGPPSNYILKAFAFQLFCAVSYVHSINVCHRDLKPKNVLVDPGSGLLQVCDFGSAKSLVPNEPSVSYIATRNYRAPELLYGSTSYGTSIDVWAAACIIAELIIGKRALFLGENNDGMIQSVAQIIGSPKPEDIKAMKGNKPYTGPYIPPVKLSVVLDNYNDDQMVDLLSRLFVYSPLKRMTAYECTLHPCFDCVKRGEVILHNGKRFFPPADTKTNFGRIKTLASTCYI